MPTVSLAAAFAVVVWRAFLDRAGLVVFFFKAGLLCLHFECAGLIEANHRTSIIDRPSHHISGARNDQVHSAGAEADCSTSWRVASNRRSVVCVKRIAPFGWVRTTFYG